jgi:hypothetical protein
MLWDRHRNDVSAWKLTLEQNCRKKVQYSGFSATSVFQWWGMPHESRKNEQVDSAYICTWFVLEFHSKCSGRATYRKGRPLHRPGFMFTIPFIHHLDQANHESINQTGSHLVLAWIGTSRGTAYNVGHVPFCNAGVRYVIFCSQTSKSSWPVVGTIKYCLIAGELARKSGVHAGASSNDSGTCFDA